eukprot:6472858-Amphidinium_carterae.1
MKDLTGRVLSPVSSEHIEIQIKNRKERRAVLCLASPTNRSKKNLLIAFRNQQISILRATTCIRDFGAETLTMIVKQETVLKRLQSELHVFEEGSEAYQARQGQIAAMNQMVEYCRLAMQKAFDYSPPPSYPSGNEP